MGSEGRQMLLEILNLAWEQETKPTDWEIGQILPIFKKGNPKDCNNYRGITVLSSAVKVYEQILNKKLKLFTEPILSECQSGFRKGRSVQDHIFTVKEIINRKRQQGEDVYMAFIDLEKAFDSVPRLKFWTSLQKLGVNNKLIRAIKSLYKNTTNYVIRKNRKSETFTTKDGLRQGGGLSPTLFNIFMDDIIKQCELRTKKVLVGYRYLQPVKLSQCAFADDIVLFAPSERELQNNLNIWNEELKNNGMKINKSKTKIMAITENNQDLDVYLEGVKLEQVDQYKYLGVLLDKTGDQEAEINVRIENTLKLYFAMNKSFINKKEISRKTKINVFKAVYRPVLTYACESWILSKRQKSKIQATEMKYLRRTIGVTRRNRIKNTQIREEVGVQSTLEFIEQRQLSWWGHLVRLNDIKPAQEIFIFIILSMRGNQAYYGETWILVIIRLL